LAVRLEKLLAEAAKKRQQLNNANRAILPESEKGRARDKAAEKILSSSAPLTDGAIITKKRGAIMSVFLDASQIHPLFPNLVTILSHDEELRFQRLLVRAETDSDAAAVLRGVWGLLERGEEIGARTHFMDWSKQYDY
jgi:hypothetical protein